jgi:hypothetical protein
MTLPVMLTAAQARAKARNDWIIYNEIRAIERAILMAVGTGSSESYVGVVLTNTHMTGETPDAISSEGNGILITEADIPLEGEETQTVAREYLQVWQGSRTDRAKDLQMSEIVKYFTDLGYSITRKVNRSTGDTFKWIIYW